jgi:hypothetical protein
VQGAPSGRVRRAPQSAAGCGEPGTNLGHEVLAEWAAHTFGGSRSTPASAPQSRFGSLSCAPGIDRIDLEGAIAAVTSRASRNARGTCG